MYLQTALLLAFTKAGAAVGGNLLAGIGDQTNQENLLAGIGEQAQTDQENNVGSDVTPAVGGGATTGNALADILYSPNVDYMATPVQVDTFTGSKRCAMINIVMDESGSMQREQKFLEDYAIPRLSNLLYSREYNYDHVFFCTNGFGYKYSSPSDKYYRHIGCSVGVADTPTGLAHDDITAFENEKGGEYEDGYNAIVESIKKVEKKIRGVGSNNLIDITTTCSSMKNNIILVTDEDRDDLTDNTIGVDQVRAAIADNNYILNEVVNVIIELEGYKIGQDTEIGIRADFDAAKTLNPTVTTVCTPIPGQFLRNCKQVWDGVEYEFFTSNLASDRQGDWKTEVHNVGLDDHLTDGQGDSIADYLPLIQDTRGAMWSIGPLRASMDDQTLQVTNQNIVEAWAEAFVDIKVDEIDCTSNCVPCHAPPCREAELGGDPHFTTWRNEHYEYHGQCDLVMLKDDKFADGLGIDVHIRTKLVRFWSYIKSVAIRIGNDILEIEGSGDIHDPQNHYWINFEYQADIDKIGGFPIKHEKFTVNWKRTWTIDLGPKYENQSIVIEIFKEFIRVRFNGGSDSFGTSAGLMGDYYSGKTLARDGHTVIDNFTELGHEWQVMPSEPKLFHELSHPQFPKKCLEPEDPHGERHRRLEESSITMEQAEEACKTLKDPLARKDCVYDILATQDLDMVGAF